MNNAGRDTEASRLQRMLPALTLMVLAPLVAEVLPGATRLSALFVLPIEILIWGGGTVLIRAAVRKYRLGWVNLLLLAAALSLAEEFLIQQTSLAPLVIKIKDVEYARAWGVNYVYFVWALVYECLFVVVIPIGLTELIFRQRREEVWLSRMGAAIITLLFFPACGLAWFTWTQIARVEVFHVEAYNPPASYVAIAVAAIVGLIALASGPWRSQLCGNTRPLRPPHPAVLFVLGGIAAVVIFGLEVLAFGIAPEFPPAVAVAIGLGLAAALIAFLPRFFAHAGWTLWHEVGLLYGTIIVNMAVFFVAFLDATPLDFYGKVVFDLLALFGLGWLAVVLFRLHPNEATSAIPKG